MTLKLYDLDSHLSSFDAVVLSCAADDGCWQIVLDQTAFFPEGGGQAADTGTLDDVHVLDVRESGDAIVHFTDSPLPVGSTVKGVLDWNKRFRRMQEHSGEHILSGLVHRLWGYNNVGFHLGDETVTMDYDGELSHQQLSELERLANEAVWKNVPITAEYPPEDRLSGLEYRSKLDLTENVRIVTIEGYDVCACCAPHVSHTGEIGAIKIIDSMRHRGGVRLTILCGSDALRQYQMLFREASVLSNLLNVPKDQLVPAVERLFSERDALESALAAREQKLNALRIKAMPDAGKNIVLIDQFDDPDAMRELVNLGMERAAGVCAAFSGSNEAGYRYIIGSKTIDLRSRAREINAALDGRGGGRPTMIQGSCAASASVIKAYFELFA